MKEKDWLKWQKEVIFEEYTKPIMEKAEEEIEKKKEMED